jgi:hypothetical protein
MKKFNAFGIVFLVLLFSFFTSCNDEETIDPLIGVWELSEVEDGITMTITLTFNADKTGSVKVMIMIEGISESETENFTYNTDSNILTMTMDGESSEVTYSISGNKLTITEDGETLVFTKK